MAYFPIYIDIKDKQCVVVGGGRIALRKIEILHQFGAKITVIAPYICDDIYNIENNASLDEFAYLEEDIYTGESDDLGDKSIHITFVKREFNDSDICDVQLVVAATDNEILNSHISDICKRKNILVNVVDVKDECTFIFPAICKKGELVISVSTGGSSPSMAHKIRKNIESVIPDYYSSLIEFLGEHRDYIKSEIHLQEQRKKVYNEFIKIVEKNQEDMSFDTINKIVAKYKKLQEGDCKTDGI